ncbi:MAG: PKD domain-containing protein [Chloroflexota bacterium]
MRGPRVLGLGAIALIFSAAFAAGIAYAFTGQTTRVSVSSAGAPASGSVSSGVLSADGRYVVFTSSASNLVTGVAGLHVYRHDRTTGATVLVDVAKTGGPSLGPAVQPTVSGDGRYVAFGSFANDLADGDTNTVEDIYVRDMQTGTTALASASSAGVVGNLASGMSGASGAHEISDDGRFVVFTSLATNFVAASSLKQQVYVKDMSTGAIVRASVNDAGDPGDQNSSTPVISGNGKVVAFRSEATNLSPLSNTTQVFTRDLVAGTTTLETPGAAAVGRASTMPALSFDGRYLAFECATALDPRDLDNGTLDVYLRDRTLGTTVLASLSSNALAGATSAGPSISGDGRWVAFFSLDDKLVAGDTGGLFDVFLYDRDHETVSLISLNDAGQQANQASSGASVSFDGGLVLFATTASNLVTSPASTGTQLYVRNLVSNQAPVLPAFGKDYPLVEAQSLRLTWDFSDNDGSTSWTATVDYGDGAGAQALALSADKTFVLDHLYAPGAYDLTVLVTDDAGATGSLVIHVVDSNVAPSVGLVSTVDLPFSRTLDVAGTFTDPGSSETYSATVNYGDGTGTQVLALGPYDASPLVGGSFALHHTYATAGAYTVTVTVSDGRGGTTAATLLANVGAYSYEFQEPVGSFFVVGRNLPVKFTVRGPDGALVLDRSVTVDVIDASGAVVAGPFVFGDQPSRSVTWSSGAYHVNVDTKDLAPGMYWLRVRFSSPTLTGEFTLGTTATAGATTTSTKARFR